MADFATISQLKLYLGITSSDNDTLLSAMLTRTTRMMQQYIGRDIVQTTYTDEKYSGDGRVIDLEVRNYPLISVSSVYDDVNRIFGSDSLLIEDTGGLASTAHYVILNKNKTENQGIIRRIDGPWFRGIENIKITYTAGYATVPDDLVQAQIDWSSYIFRNKDMRIGISGYRLGDFSLNFKDNSSKDPNGGVLPPDDVRMVLDYYKEYRMESTSDDRLLGEVLRYGDVIR